ncbi:hypothetical protein C2S53_007258 [Perilla frutescens var. hirtella]|uniref:Uncharacterized protein n=1 Tax=Perilla frutescens var. hirtella TaxID=608512 RepID=A0AAD4JFY3_PERFH|nr:hypothetical protein C2S53_007258 [Perilla frutescens var. hirtella]
MGYCYIAGINPIRARTLKIKPLSLSKKVEEPIPEQREESKQGETEEEVSEQKEQQKETSEPSQANTLVDEPFEESPPKQRVDKATSVRAGEKLAGEPSSRKRKAGEGTPKSEPKRSRGVGSPTSGRSGSGPPLELSADESNMSLGIVSYLDLQKDNYMNVVTVVPDSAKGVDAKWAVVGDGSIYQSGATKGYCLNNDALRFCHRMQDVVDDEEGIPVFAMPRADPSSLLMIVGTSGKPPAGKA